jgi:hypothetical protein
MGIKKIELSEDNGFLFGGVPNLIVCTATFDDGRQVRFPHSALGSISDLYADLNGIKSESMPAGVLLKLASPDIVQILPEPAIEPLKDVDPNKIEKGDIVKCIFLENRNDHMGSPATVDLAVGGLYRVVKVLTNGYSVLDDSAGLKLPMTLFNHEVKLHEKHKPYVKKQLFLSEDVSCPKCNTATSCGLHSGFYVGTCECGQEIRISREEVKGGQGSNRSVKAVESGTVAGDVQEVV